MHPRLHYFSLISTDKLNHRFGANFHVGPASRKVLGTTLALLSAKVRPVVVSALIPYRRGTSYSSIERIERIPYVRLFALGRGAFRRLTASVSFLFYTISVVRSNDAVLLYNAFPEYILAAFYRFLIGHRAILDVEDGPRVDERGPRGAMNIISFHILRALCDQKVVTVSKALAETLKLTKYHVNYGVSFQTRNSKPPTERFRADAPLSILYGGAIMPETGSDLFCKAVRQLADNHPKLRVTFHITGVYDSTFLEGLRLNQPNDCETEIIVHGDLTAAEYNALLRSMDVGLCLKLPSHSMGQTTFPSKVVEICAAGVLLCTTRVSDVPDIFDDNNAVVLKNEEVDELVGAIANICHNKEEMQHRAHCGRLMVEHRFGVTKVGSDLRAFIFAESPVTQPLAAGST
ncbi:glycosyltransferase family 4 protein [Bradyrhizobium sp. DN5]|uniref:glycosyltransferase family 4 protein n=1 Tax=Bradyrhizobium sp. DN5 TaxID=3056950 RepID=UPI003523DF12